MRAASYIGRVGGLAVALGVGSAIFTGRVSNASRPPGERLGTDGAHGPAMSNATVAPPPR